MYKRVQLLSSTKSSLIYEGISEENEQDKRRSVVLKRVFTSTPLNKDYIPKEVSIMKKLKHKHILHLLDFYVPRKKTFSFYLVLERCTTSLDHVINTITPSMRDTLFMQIFSAIEYMHSKGIAHRDIKPSNILLSAEGNIKVSDFGSATYILPGQNDLEKTPGTIPYMAPELLLGSCSYTLSIDLWSAGCVYWEMTTHSIAFPGTTEIDQLVKIVSTLGITENDLKAMKELPYSYILRPHAPCINHTFTSSEWSILSVLLSYNPGKRFLSQEQKFNLSST